MSWPVEVNKNISEHSSLQDWGHSIKGESLAVYLNYFPNLHLKPPVTGKAVIQM